jgi:hypothetical protein
MHSPAIKKKCRRTCVIASTSTQLDQIAEMRRLLGDFGEDHFVRAKAPPIAAHCADRPETGAQVRGEFKAALPKGRLNLEVILHSTCAAMVLVQPPQRWPVLGLTGHDTAGTDERRPKRLDPDLGLSTAKRNRSFPKEGARSTSLGEIGLAAYLERRDGHARVPANPGAI